MVILWDEMLNKLWEIMKSGGNLRALGYIQFFKV